MLRRRWGILFKTGHHMFVAGRSLVEGGKSENRGGGKRTKEKEGHFTKHSSVFRNPVPRDLLSSRKGERVSVLRLRGAGRSSSL